MSQRFEWKRGQFLKFFATMKIRIGGTNTLDVHKGDEFEYDGTIVKYAGAEFSQIGLRGAIEQGWAVLDPSQTDKVAPVRAPRNIAKAQTKNTDLSRVQRTESTVIESNSLDEETVLEVSDRRSNSNPRSEPNKLTSENNRRPTAGQRASGISSSDADSQDGEVIGRVRSAAKLNNVDITKAGDLAQQIENRALGKPELFNKNKTVVREGVTIKTNIGSVDNSVQSSQDDNGRVVAKVRTTKTTRSEGIEVKDTSSVKKDYSEPAQKDLSDKHRKALALDPNFPLDWDFMASVEKRMNRARELSGDSRFLKALYASESASVQKELKKEFSKVLQ